MRAPTSSSCRAVMALTAPRVPTGMNAGVSTIPCGVSSSPRRASPSRCVTRKEKDMGQDIVNAQRPTPNSQVDVPFAADEFTVGSWELEGGSWELSAGFAERSSILCGVKRLRVGVLYG